MLDTNTIKRDFPVLAGNNNLVYLDNAATSQTPQPVIDAMNHYYVKQRANVHRGLYQLSEEATKQYEQARQTIAEYLGAKSEEIIFTSGATAGLNVLAQSIGAQLKKGDEVVLTRLEHHANLVPWQQAAKKYGFSIRYIEITESGHVDITQAEQVITSNTKVVAFTAASNALGSVLPVEKIVELAKRVDAISIVDAAQAIAHMPINVKEWGCDYLVFSGHKMYGPTGIGVLYGTVEQLETLEPTQFGGDMVESVTYEDATWAPLPTRLEAGTPNIVGAIGLATAFVYLNHVGWQEIMSHEADLTKYAIQQLQKEVTIIGPQLSQDRIGVISFTIPHTHPHDIADILGKDNICVRAGHHCAMPLMKHMGISGTTRISIGLYNTRADIDALIESIQKVKTLFSS